MTVPAPLRILLLDDNPDDRALVVRTLSGEFPGVEVVEAIDAASLERVLTAGGFDLVITDFHLHWTDGLKNLSAVKGRHPRIPVIMFTGTGTEETAVAAMKAGLDDYVIKAPQHFGRLAIAVRSALAKLRDQDNREEAERRYQSLFNGIPIGLFRTSPDGRVLDANPAIARLLGYPDPESLKEISVASLYLRPEDRENWKANVEEWGSVSDLDFSLRRRDGRIIWVRENARVVRGSDGKVLYFEGSLEDITARKEAEEALKASEEKYRSLLKGVADEVILLDPRGKILFANDAATVSLGGGAPLAEKNIGDFFPREKLRRWLEILRKVIRTIRPGVYVDWRGGRYLESVLSPILAADGRLAGVTVVSRDITDRKQAEEALRESEEKHRQVVDNASEVIVVVQDGMIRLVNPALVAMLGFSAQELKSTPFSSFLHPDDRALVMDRHRKRMQDDTIPTRYTFRLMTKDGNTRWVETNVVRIAWEGRPATLGLLSDITERKQAEEKLQIFSNAVDSAFDYMMLTDTKGNITYGNKSAIGAFGYTAEEFLKLNVADLETDPQVHKKALQSVTETGGWSGEVMSISKNKKKFPSLLSAFIVKDEEGNPQGTMGILKEITELKKAEERLERINACLLGLVPDFDANINRLTALCGELLGATCALYNRLEGNLLCSLGQWHTPPDYDPKDRPDGHICYDVIRRGDDRALVIRNLPATPYAATDPNVVKYGLKTYIGQIVRCAGQSVGSLCVVFQQDHEPTEDEKLVLGIIASSIGVEEERKRAAEALKESEEQFRGLFEVSPVGIFLLDSEGNITAVNDRGGAIYGYAREEMLRKNVRDIVPKRLAGNYPRLVANIRRRKSLVFESEGRKKGGRLFPVELTVSLFRWKDKEFFQVLVQDAGEKRQAEEAERLRKISEALLNFQEEERKKIARDLHDHLGQDLAAIKISLEMSKTSLPDGERAMRKEIDETVEMVDKAIGDVRSLSASLRPASLDGLGLVPCLRHELAYLASRGGLKIDLDTRRFAGRLPPEKEIIVYRIVQEAMTNILKHAQASKVRVALSRRGGLVRLAVSDDGRGFNPEKEKKAIGLGLMGMRERVAVVGGEFAIASHPGRGTRIVVTLPAAPKGREKA